MLRNKSRNPSPCPSPTQARHGEPATLKDAISASGYGGRGDAAAAVPSVGQPGDVCLALGLYRLKLEVLTGPRHRRGQNER
jgi:hypothetical protein